MNILFIQTGGTIDKDYPKKIKGYSFEISEPAVKRILEKINPNFKYQILNVLKKDSLDINKEDRIKIFDVCNKSNHNKIVITHGTDSMIETARELSKIENKTIILTGSFKPERFTDSDASFNIGLSIGALQVLKKGIYIAINGRVYLWNDVTRDEKTGQFIKNEKSIK